MNPIGKRTNCTEDLCTKDTRQADKMGTLAIGAYFTWNTASYLPDTAFAIKFNVVNSKSFAKTTIVMEHSLHPCNCTVLALQSLRWEVCSSVRYLLSVCNCYNIKDFSQFCRLFSETTHHIQAKFVQSFLRLKELQFDHHYIGKIPVTFKILHKNLWNNFKANQISYMYFQRDVKF